MNAFITGGSGFLGRELIRALKAAGHEVTAIARSPKSAAAVRDAGAKPVAGDLDSSPALTAGMQGCDVVIHAAAHTEEWDTDENFHRVNVTGAENVIAAAKAAKVRRLLLISSEAVLADGKPMHNVDETVPRPAHPIYGYPASKALCEERVLAANGPELETVVLRPRCIWGRGDTANLLKFVKAIADGRMSWIDNGRYLSSTCHVANACEGALLAAEKGKPGEIYFVTDGPPIEFREWLSGALKTQGQTAPDRSVPHWAAWASAVVAEAIWRALGIKKAPFATKVAVGLMGQEITINDAKARRELGYVGKMSIADGLAEMARLPPVKG